MGLDYKSRYDIFICGGSEHFDCLKRLLPKLHPFGRVHLASITLTCMELEKLAPHCDIVHNPEHDPDGYLNFNLFCIRDINRLARAPYFIKLDADVSLQDDWIDIVEKGVAAHPEGVLLGIKEGLARINVEMTGPLIKRVIGREVRVTNGRKLIGGFYVGRTDFFKRHNRLMQIMHELFYCFENGKRSRPTLHPEEWPESESEPEAFNLRGDIRNLQRIGNEDTLRSLVINAAGASERMFLLDSKESIQVPHGPGLGHNRNW